MAEQIQLRRDTSSNWESVNPILAQGELGIELDTNKFKIGNGVDSWTSLEYASGGASDYPQLSNKPSINGTTLVGNLVIDKSTVGLGNVDNTSDLNKPISTATQTALTNLTNTVNGKASQSDLDNLSNTVATKASQSDLDTTNQNVETLSDGLQTAEQDIQELQNDVDNIETDITTLEGEVNDIIDLIPDQATSQNQLADKNFVNSSIGTNTSNFLGTLDVVDNLGLSYGASISTITVALNSYSFQTKTNNDYCYVVNKDTDGNTIFQRFKYNSNTVTFEYEFTLNNSSFTAVQWAAINSGITSALVSKITTNETNIANLQTSKQDKIDSSHKLSSSLIDSVVNSIGDSPSTSALTSESAIYNYIASGNNGKPRALDSVDLNTISATGFYSCNVCTNRPTENNGVMLVLKNALSSDNVVQVYWTYTADVMWIRHKDLGNWKNWESVIKSGNVKTTTSSIAGNVYDVTYINTMLGNVESLMANLYNGGGAE